jgi:hypothetical protein
MKPAATRRWYKSPRTIFAILLSLPLIALVVAWAWCIRMPGASHGGALGAATPLQLQLAEELARDVQILGGDIGERHAGKPDALKRAASHIDQSLTRAGFRVERHHYQGRDEQVFVNLEAQQRGQDHELGNEFVIVGAHYDGAVGAPAANDNGTGVAALLALARRFAGRKHARMLRFVAFANEEPPHFQQPDMGSVVYAAACKARGDDVVAMLSLETMGYYRDGADTQAYPFPLSLFYPDVGDFIAIVGDLSSRALVHRVVEDFSATTPFPSEGAALPGSIPGVGWSDHWSFWQHGYPAVMITDTAPFRYPAYHTAEDTPDKVDHERLARVVLGVDEAITRLLDGARAE